MSCSISFLVASKNSYPKIKNCLESLLAIASSNDEIIVCDASTDILTISYLESFKGNEIVHILRGTGLGIFKDRLAMINSAKKDYIYFVDSDDLINGDIRDICFFQNDVVFTQSTIKTSNSHLLIKRFRYNKPTELTRKEVFEKFLFSFDLNPLWSCLIKTNTAKKAISTFSSENSYPTIGEDRFIMSKILLEATSFVFIPYNFYLYCLSKQSATSSKKPSLYSDSIILLNDGYNLCRKNNISTEKFLSSYNCRYYVYTIMKYIFAISKRKQDYLTNKSVLLSSAIIANIIKHYSPNALKEKIVFKMFKNDNYAIGRLFFAHLV
jgi:glycosyltransferase involved in cell wall biosynthesis